MTIALEAKLSRGNDKVNKRVLTYSRTPIASCPGASDACKEVCYALKAYKQYLQTKAQWDGNAAVQTAPTLPTPKRDGKRTLLRIHVSGDFDSADYIESWIDALASRPDVTAWGYTKSWRIPALMPALERLRALPNMQLFASVDKSIPEPPPAGWRVAGMGVQRGPQCMETTGKQPDCESCRYCFDGQKGDTWFPIH